MAVYGWSFSSQAADLLCIDACKANRKAAIPGAPVLLAKKNISDNLTEYGNPILSTVPDQDSRIMLDLCVSVWNVVAGCGCCG